MPPLTIEETCSNHLMNITNQQELQSLEVIRPDMAAAYSALARRMAAIDAILSSNQWDEHCLRKVRSQVDSAMVVIEWAEKVQFVIKPTSDSD